MAISMQIEGKCHCGNIAYVLRWPEAAAEIPVRACGCAYCAKHGAAWTSHPDGELAVEIDAAPPVSTYRFGTHTADFHVCARCGVVPFVTSIIDGHAYAVVNTNTFEGFDPSLLRRIATDFEGEQTEQRLERRKRKWIPAVRISSRGRVRKGLTGVQTKELILAVTRVMDATQACADRGDERMFSVLRRYYAVAAAEAASAGGRVVKGVGDGVVLTFPSADPGEAVEALRRFQTKSNALWHRFDRRCRVQVKVGAGTLATGMLGPPGEERPDIIGSALNSLFKAPWGEFEIAAELKHRLTEAARV